MTRIAPDWLNATETRRVMTALATAKPLFVGGCVRDALMGRPTQDIDIAVVTPPAETMRLAEAAGLSAHPTGADHGVVTLVADGAPFEVATLRRDVATDGRRAVVAFTDDPAEDAARRDFTMNALYADPAGEVLDPLGGGLGDLTARHIRFIGEAEARISEDYLRILRFFRFHAQFRIERFDEAGLAACHALADGLSLISKERIGAEIMKLLAAPDPEPALGAMGPVLAASLPGAAAFSGLTAVEADMGLAARASRRLAALGGDLPGDALRLSRTDAKLNASLLEAKDAALDAAALGYRYGADIAEDALALRALEGARPPTGWREEVAKGAAAIFPVTARDLIAAGEEQGPALGSRLKRLEEEWVASAFSLSRDALLASI